MSFVNGMFEYGSLQATERLVEFTSKRHRVLTDNIANVSTPYYKPKDLSPVTFQSILRDAIDRRDHRGVANPLMGRLDMRSTADFKYARTGTGPETTLSARPTLRNDNILFHDQNNRDVERLMQSLAENTMAHTMGIDFARSHFGLLKAAISERPV